jgi:hypothetical protein
MNDTIKIVVVGVLLSWAIMIMCGFYVGQGCKKCPEIVTTVTTPDTCRDTTPNLPLIVTGPKPTHLKPLQPKNDTNTPLVGKTDSLKPTPVPGVVVTDYVLSAEPVTYSTLKKYGDGDSIAISASSRILPITPPSDWRWDLRRFKAPDTTRAIIKVRHFGFGVTVGGGYSADQLAQKQYFPRLQVTVGLTWLK